MVFMGQNATRISKTPSILPRKQYDRFRGGCHSSAMPQVQLGGFYQVSKSSTTPGNRKRLKQETSPPTVTLESKTDAKRSSKVLLNWLEGSGKADVEQNEQKQSVKPLSPSNIPNTKIKAPVKTQPPKLKPATVIQRVSPPETVIQRDSPPATVIQRDSPPVQKALPAHERFANLIQPDVSQQKQKTLTPTSKVVELATSVQAAQHAAQHLETTQTEVTELPTGLPLPHSLRVLFDLFRSCDTVVSMLHNRSEVCSFDKVKPGVQEIVRRNFEESHVGQFLAVYPVVYVLRYDKQMDKFTRRPTGGYVLVLAPNLRTDGTQMGHDSPSKGHLIFNGTRMIQRRNRFQRLLLSHVLRAHRAFLQTRLGMDASKLPNDSELRRWHPRFCLETMVPPIQPAPLPMRPDVMDAMRVTTARDAVRAFQARALFREADVCQSVAAASHHSPRKMHCSIPSPSKASACSPRKSTATTTASLPPRAPALALFSNTLEKKTNDNIEATSSAPAPCITAASSAMAKSLKGVSESLLAKVRAREMERRMLTQLLQNGIPESRRAIYARLPGMIPHVWTFMRSTNNRPVPMTTIANRVADAHQSGLNNNVALEHLMVLQELCPHWLEKLDWVTPHMRVRDADVSPKGLIDMLKAKLAKEGFHF